MRTLRAIIYEEDPIQATPKVEPVIDIFERDWPAEKPLANFVKYVKRELLFRDHPVGKKVRIRVVVVSVADEQLYDRWWTIPARYHG